MEKQKENLAEKTGRGLRLFKLILFLPYKALSRGDKGTLALTVFIMSLVFVNLVFVSSILLGVIDSINKQSIENLFGNIIIEPEDGETYIEKVDQLREIINGTPGVSGSSVHYVNNVIVAYDKKKTGKDVKDGGWQVKSINVADEKTISNVYLAMVEGEYLDPDDRQEVIIGKEISGYFDADFVHLSLGVRTGDLIDITFSNGVTREYRIKGVFDVRNMQANSLVFITDKEMESVLKARNKASEIIIKIKEGYSETEVINSFRSNGITKEDINPWTEFVGFTISAVESFDLIKVILQAVAVLVAISIIFIISFVNATNRRKQIGILKAIGMDQNIVVASYVLQALFYAVSGVVLGTLTVYFVLDPYLAANPLDFPMGFVSLSISQNDMLLSVFFLIIAALIGGYFPSYRVAKKNIVDTIWGT